MMMDYCRSRPIERFFARAMNPARDVDIFGIHEKPLVEKTVASKGICAEKHEAS